MHLKGTGWLEYQCQSSLLARAHSKAYQIIPESTSPGTSMVLPLASSGLPILKAARTDPTVNHIDLRASDSPGLVVRKHMSKKSDRTKVIYIPDATSKAEYWVGSRDRFVDLPVLYESFRLEFKRIAIGVLIMQHRPDHDHQHKYANETHT